MERELFQLVTGAFFTLNGAVLWVIWREIEKLRKESHANNSERLVQQHQIKELALDVEKIFDRLETRTT